MFFSKFKICNFLKLPQVERLFPLTKACEDWSLPDLHAFQEKVSPWFSFDILQSKTYDREGVSLACFRSNFGGLVLGCIDSYDSNQIFIFQRFSRSTRFTFLHTAPYSKFADFWFFFSQNLNFRIFAILPIFVEFSSTLSFSDFDEI